MEINNKKGDVTDILTFLIMVFILAVALIVVLFANDIVVDVINETDLNNTEVAASSISHLNQMNTTTVQYGYVAIFAFLIIGMMITSFLVRIHPIFLFMYIIFLAVGIFVGVPLANTYQEVIYNNALSDIALQQTAMNWIIQYLPFILLGVGAISIIVTLTKLFSGGRNAEQL